MTKTIRRQQTDAGLDPIQSLFWGLGSSVNISGTIPPNIERQVEPKSPGENERLIAIWSRVGDFLWGAMNDEAKTQASQESSRAN